ncbi:GNAT family N-acetyltransferase, partial [Leucobacter sp. M11]|uniref:GNAT family N-acetyltransferase n=1 Tax=Leucobacter sp. M11 TaxID=2993565 RepID=UPI002D7FF224
MQNDDPALTADDFRITEIPFDDARAEGIRAAMNREMSLRYAGSFDDFTPEQVARANASMVLRAEEAIVSVLALAPDGSAAAHAMLREHRGDWEVKRVVTAPEYRGFGLAARVMTALHEYARERGVPRLVLQCGNRQPEAVALYTKLGYTPIDTYEPYRSDMPNSLCFEIIL